MQITADVLLVPSGTSQMNGAGMVAANIAKVESAGFMYSTVIIESRTDVRLSIQDKVGSIARAG